MGVMKQAEAVASMEEGAAKELKKEHVITQADKVDQKTAEAEQAKAAALEKAAAKTAEAEDNIKKAAQANAAKVAASAEADAEKVEQANLNLADEDKKQALAEFDEMKKTV